MIRGGVVCKSCTVSNCCEQYKQLEIECPECDGKGCGDDSKKNGCENGRFKIDQCPQSFIRDYVPAFRLVDLFEKGIAPVEGGAMAQTCWFLNAHRQLKHEDAVVLEDLTS